MAPPGAAQGERHPRLSRHQGPGPAGRSDQRQKQRVRPPQNSNRLPPAAEVPARRTPRGQPRSQAKAGGVERNPLARGTNNIFYGLESANLQTVRAGRKNRPRADRAPACSSRSKPKRGGHGGLERLPVWRDKPAQAVASTATAGRRLEASRVTAASMPSARPLTTGQPALARAAPSSRPREAMQGGPRAFPPRQCRARALGQSVRDHPVEARGGRSKLARAGEEAGSPEKHPAGGRQTGDCRCAMDPPPARRCGLDLCHPGFAPAAVEQLPAEVRQLPAASRAIRAQGASPSPNPAATPKQPPEPPLGGQGPQAAGDTPAQIAPRPPLFT